MRSSLTILKFNELIKEQERILAHYERTYRVKILNGQMNEWQAHHSIECLKRTIKLLRQYDHNPQTDLFAKNQELNRR